MIHQKTWIHLHLSYDQMRILLNYLNCAILLNCGLQNFQSSVSFLNYG